MANLSESQTSQNTASSYWVDALVALGLSASIVGILLAAFSGLGTRWGWWDFRSGLGYFRDSVYAGGAGLLISTVALSWILLTRKGTGRSKSLVGLVLGLLVAGNFFSWYHQARSVPPIHDITTDFETPPAFEAILHLRKDAMNPPEYGGPSIADQQKKAFPDIQPLFLMMPLDDVWAHCLATAKSMEWTIVETDEKRGRIEATDQTFWFGFKDDIVVRVTAPAARPGWSRVDVRSVSRVGKGDVGTNAKRIRKFLKAVNASVF